MSIDKLPLPDTLMLFEGAPCGLVVTTEDGMILRVNQTFSHWLGFTAQELCSQRFQDLLTMDGRIFHQTHWAPLMQMQGSVAEVKLDMQHRDNRTVTLLLNGVRREHGNGAFHELALFGITDRDKYERELVSARKLAEALLKEKTATEAALQKTQTELSQAYETARRRAEFAEQMVAIVSHDLKNPLTAIMMASDLLGRSSCTATAKETQLLGHISQSAERAHRMIDDLLDFTLAKVGHGIGISPAGLDLHTVTGLCIDELRVAFPKATLIHQALGNGRVCLDGDRLHQVIGNLVANSVAYGDLKKPITVTSRLDEDSTLVSVHNHGPVIPHALQAVLFEPMTRGTEVDSNVRSVGLGLFIVREIARAHGGRVSVSSSETCGTTFNIHFPTVPAI